MKAQGTIEYLVILAVIVVVSLIVVSLITNSTNTAGISAGESKLYWQAQPLAITEAAIDSEGDGKLVIKNNTGELIEITEVLVDGEPIPFENGTLSYDGKLVLHAQYLEGCIDQGSYEIEITYKTENGLVKKVSGDMPLILNCDQDIEKLFLEAGVSLIEPSNNGVGEKNQDFTFSVSGSDINQCTLVSEDISGDYNIIGSELTGEQTISVSGLTGMGTNYEWNIECCNVRGECARADNNYTFVIPNQAPVVSFNPEPSGTYSGGVPITISVSDPDGAVSEFTATISYKDNENGTPIEANSFNLSNTCFEDGNYFDSRNCEIEWYIDNPSISGQYWIDVNVFDGEMSTIITTGPITVDPCLLLSGEYTMTENTDLCSGEYNIDDSDNDGVLIFGASGPNGDKYTLDCHGAKISGTGNYGIYASGKARIEVKNCEITGYGTGIYFNDVWYSNVLDSNIYSTTNGISYRSTDYASQNPPKENDVIGNNITNTTTGIKLQGYHAYSADNLKDMNISNNKLNNNSYGIGYYNSNNSNIIIENNEMKNSSSWAVELYRGSNITLSGNDLTGSANGYKIGSNNIVRDTNFTPFGITGTVLYFNEGKHNLVENCEMKNPGSKGIFVYSNNYSYQNPARDNNFVSNEIENKGTAIHFQGYHASNADNHNTIMINDNNLNNNGYAIGYYNANLNNLTITNNQMKNSSSWAINLQKGSHIKIENNDLLNSANGIKAKNNITIDGLEDSNISGTPLSFYGDHISVTNSNLSKSGARGGVGINLYAPSNVYDINIINVNMSNRQYGIQLDSYYTGYYSFNDTQIIDSNFSGTHTGIRVVDNTTQYDFNLQGNDFSNISSWPINLPRSYRFNISPNNNFNKSANGLNLGGSHKIYNLDLSDDDIAGTALAFRGNHIHIENVDVSKKGLRTGNGLYFDDLKNTDASDINIINTNLSNRQYGVRLGTYYTGYQAFRGTRIIDSNFDNTYDGINNVDYSSFHDFTISNNSFRNVSRWPINLSNSYNFNIDQSNDLTGSTNGYNLGGRQTMQNLDFSGYNIPGTVLAFRGDNLHLENLNLSTDSTQQGTGILIEDLRNVNFKDVNVIGVDFTNRQHGLRLGTYYTGYQAYEDTRIEDCVFSGNQRAISNVDYSHFYDFSIKNNIFSGVTQYILLLPRGGNHTIKSNDFINNSGSINIVSVNDANSNYWSENTGCTSPYSYSTITDYSPVCSQIN